MITIERVDDAIARIQANIQTLKDLCQVPPERIQAYIAKVVAKYIATLDNVSIEEAQAYLQKLTQGLKNPVNTLIWQCDRKALDAIDRKLIEQVRIEQVRKLIGQVRQ